MALLLVVILALPFALGPMRTSGQGARTVIGILIGAGFVLLSQTLESSGRLFDLPPWIVGWGPTVLLAALTFGAARAHALSALSRAAAPFGTTTTRVRLRRSCHARRSRVDQRSTGSRARTAAATAGRPPSRRSVSPQVSGRPSSRSTRRRHEAMPSVWPRRVQNIPKKPDDQQHQHRR